MRWVDQLERWSDFLALQSYVWVRVWWLLQYCYQKPVKKKCCFQLKSSPFDSNWLLHDLIIDCNRLAVSLNFLLLNDHMAIFNIASNDARTTIWKLSCMIFHQTRFILWMNKAASAIQYEKKRKDWDTYPPPSIEIYSILYANCTLTIYNEMLNLHRKQFQRSRQYLVHVRLHDTSDVLHDHNIGPESL